MSAVDLYLHTWGCNHSEIVDANGTRINLLVAQQAGLEPTPRVPLYGCPACHDHDNSHLHMMTRPRTDAVPLPPPLSAGPSPDLFPEQSPELSCIDHDFNMSLAEITTDTSARGLRPTAAAFIPTGLPAAVNPENSETVISNYPRPFQTGALDLPVHRPQQPPRNLHKIGYPCPQGSPACHWHHSDINPCHISWQRCGLAVKAAKATYYASIHEQKAWSGAPVGWNAQHATCYNKTEHNPGRCHFHEQCYQETKLTI